MAQRYTGAAMRAGLVDEYGMESPVRGLHRGDAPFFAGAGQLGEPEPGGDADGSRRRGAGQGPEARAVSAIPLLLF